MDFIGNMEDSRSKNEPKAEPPSGTARLPDGVYMLPGRTAGGQGWRVSNTGKISRRY